MTSPTSTPSFTLSRTGLELRFRQVHLAARQWLTADYVRIRLEGADLRGFTSLGSDDHLRVFFPDTPPASVEGQSAPSGPNSRRKCRPPTAKRARSGPSSRKRT